MRPTRFTSVLLSLLLCIVSVPLSGNTLAQDAKVRSTLQTKGDTWVGQKVTVVVELLAPGYFASAPAFDLPEPQGVLMMPPAEHPVVDNETIDDTMYSIQRHELATYPMRAGKQSIPAFTIRFSYKPAPLDPNEISASVETKPLSYTVKLPPGADGMGQVLSARDLKVRETWKPEPNKDDVMAGQAFTRTVTYTAPDIPGMLFPPFAAGKIDGLGIYTKPQASDQTERGSLVGQRRDVITYVCQRPGQYVVPAARFNWYDMETSTIRSIDLPLQTLNVVANPKLATLAAENSDGMDTSQPTSAIGWKTGAIAIMILCVIAIGLSHRGRPSISKLLLPLRPQHLQPLNPGNS